MKLSKTRKCRVHGLLTEGMFEIYEDSWSLRKKTRCMLCMAVLEKALETSLAKKEIEKVRWVENWIRREEKHKQEIIALNKRKEEELWDCVVRKELMKGVKLKGNQKILFAQNISKELLQLKRAQMKLERAIKTKQEQIEYQKEIERDQQIQKEHEEYIKKGIFPCTKHGNVQHIRSGKNLRGEQYYKCRFCHSDLKKKHYQKNKEYIQNKHKEYRKNNQEKIKEIRLKYKEKLRVKDSKHETIKK